MVKIGDRIEIENGDVGEVTDMVRATDGRYFIFYRIAQRKENEIFLEGDISFRVIG